MQYNRIIQFWLVLAFFSLIFCFYPFSSLALDVNNERPVPYWGLASGEWKEGSTNFTIYSEPEATIVISNVAPTTLPDLLFNPECQLDQPAAVSPCFYLFGPSGAKLYNSRAYANDFLKSAVAVLNYAPTNVIGDTYMSGDLSNFAYWGRHLRQTADQSDSNAFWQQTNYQFNSQAQAYWKADDSNKNQKMTETINRLLLNAKDASSVNGILTNSGSGVYNWLARSLFGVCGRVSGCSEENQYPEGVFWQTKNGCSGSSCTSVSIADGGQVNYRQKSTLAIKSGNLTISDSINIDSTDLLGKDSAALGFIVENGDVIIRNLSSKNTLTIRASIFVPNGTIKVYGGNVDLIGSFVAKNFLVYDVGQGQMASDVNFIYDSRGENAFPPGFRDLQVLTRQTE
ncbi:MAG: hypothetical protein Athens101428_314 [Candidatus Berkelbacteria bacterium Athens1014_28]|uniref:Uncharacterized protein n=1 Tax=Candidatus Berkelbacteria bacterium Athens1014_28 TaxID=2017145 RepID=A0A554LNB2_9BACT|nr:MAG: hypothetical protein Athens101428_314 [Candidatus Berkelbacteria bacterium Athens1014_28]